MVSVRFIVSSLEWHVEARPLLPGAALETFNTANPRQVAAAGYTHGKGRKVTQKETIATWRDSDSDASYLTIDAPMCAATSVSRIRRLQCLSI
jgi:hypothetical protein